ncbi:MAG TPA: hypothetical protein VK589_02725 [Chryseolinea sp.]|nr:hypothetical protein [Chryseolinea sp.]
MTGYALYTMYFLFLLLRKKGIKHAFCLTEKETKFILVGLVIYCGSYLFSAALIAFDLKVDTYRIVSHHAILLAICVILYLKMRKTDAT